MEEWIVELLGSFTFGKVILVIFGIAVIVLTILEKTIGIFSGAADRREARKEKAMQKALEDQKFRENIQSIVDQVPKLSEQIANINDKITEYSDKENRIEETQQQCIEKMEGIQQDIVKLKESSDKQDAEISQHLQNTVDRVDKLQASIKDVSDKVNLMIDADVDEFRIYLMQCYNRYVVGNEKMDRQTKQILKTKFKRYKAEGGNGWAESLMQEINEVDAEYDLGNSMKASKESKKTT